MEADPTDKHAFRRYCHVVDGFVWDAVSDVVEKDNKKGDAETPQQAPSNSCHIKPMERFFLRLMIWSRLGPPPNHS